MLKTYPTAISLPKRLKLASAVGRFNSTNSPSSSSDPTYTQFGYRQYRRQQRPASITTTPSSTMSASDTTLPPSSSRATQTKAEKDSKARGAGSAFFPLGYKEAAQQWWSSVTARQAERNVLSFIPFLREATADNASTASQLSDLANADPFGHRVWRQTMVPLSGKDRALNEFSIERVGEQVDDTLVMLHGYGAGLGFFYKNYEPLTRVPGWKLYSLDMLGMGNSARPPFKIHAKDQQGKIREAEAWFIDALEEWRKARKIERFTLMGHSLGGYLAVSYALKYPGRLNKLILASPAGIPEDPWAVNAAMPEPEESAYGNEFTQDQESIVNRETPEGGANTAFIQADPKDKKAVASSAGKPNNNNNNGTNTKKDTAPPRRPIPGWASWLWDANVSPFSIVRMTGPLGPRFVSGWTSRRFNHLPPDEKEALHTYSYSLFRQKGSGEYVLPYLLAPGAFARSPVINRIQDVGRQIIAQSPSSSSSSSSSSGSTPEQPAAAPIREAGFPIVFLYGENDWMDVAGGYAAEEKIRKRVEQALTDQTRTEEERKRENGSAKVVVIRRAGHHLYIDNPDEFNEVVRKELEETKEWGRRMRAEGLLPPTPVEK
ncbi:alpha/beta hydrolase [Neurospora intermedia]|uniref:Alpha/beta hydrolase n=1 Tax=Neurospora intermedia TaxID=5142 RepID=A0ABR3DK77_NEUIN